MAVRADDEGEAKDITTVEDCGIRSILASVAERCRTSSRWEGRGCDASGQGVSAVYRIKKRNATLQCLVVVTKGRAQPPPVPADAI